MATMYDNVREEAAMDNFGRNVVATACVLASALVAGTPRSFGATPVVAAEAKHRRSSGSGCDGADCTALALADRLCDGKEGGLTLASEACRVPSGALVAPPAPLSDDYEPAWMSGLRKLDLPFHDYPRIERYVHYWSASREGRRLFRTWLRRSGKYRADVDKALASRRLPLDLAALVFVESGFSPTAKSKAGAVGLWQLMPQTAKDYGLIIDRDYDERRSVTKSSDAAVDHLASLYGKLGEWELVLAAYDMGARALTKKQEALALANGGGGDDANADFWQLAAMGALPRETAQYVPSILALAVVLKNLDRFGYDTLKLEPPSISSDLDVPAGVPLGLVARAAGTSLAKIHELNPEFLRDVVPDAANVVHVPSGGLARARVMLPHLLFDFEGPADGAQAEDPYDWGVENGGYGRHAPAGAPRRDGGRSRRTDTAE